MKKYIYTIVAATAMLASCSQDAELNEVINNQPKAITEIGASTWATTRAKVDGTDNTKVNWESGDQLGVFGEGATGVVAYTLDGTAGSTSGTFKNAESTITTVQAMMYPYQSTATWAESKLTCEIPPVQTATVGSFDKAAAIMYSIGSSTDATLDYAVNFLKVTISSSETDVHAITISSDDYLSGTVKLSSSGVEEGTLKSVTLVASGYPESCLAAGDYYIAVKKLATGGYTNPSISYTYIYSSNHTAIVKTKAGSSSLQFATGTNVKPISVNFSSGIVTDRTAKQLWEHGPFFATVNVGATITDYTDVTTYDEANVGGWYSWGGKISGSDSDYYSGEDYDNGNLKPENDTATKLWGSAWRMPTKAEFNALDAGVEITSSSNNVTGTNTTWTWLGAGYVSGCTLRGYKIVGNGNFSGNSVFLPAAESRDPGQSGQYWSSTPDFLAQFKYCLSFSSHEENSNDSNFRDKKYSVRAVLR